MMVKPEEQRNSGGSLGELFFMAFCGAAIILMEVMGGLNAFGTDETPDVVKILMAALLIMQSWRLYKAAG